MSIVTVLTKSTPNLNGLKFDAVLESTFSATLDVTTYPMESGARASDHALFNPIEYTMTIMASNNPLRPQITDFIGGAVSNFINLPTIAGLSSGFLSGRPDTHAAAVLTALVGMMVKRETMSVFGGDIQLSEMIITGVERTRTPENENGLECIITMQELPLVERILLRHSTDTPYNPVKTDTNDQAATAAGKYIHKGIARVQSAGNTINDRVSGVFSV